MFERETLTGRPRRVQPAEGQARTRGQLLARRTFRTETVGRKISISSVNVGRGDAPLLPFRLVQIGVLFDGLADHRGKALQKRFHSRGRNKENFYKDK